MDESPYRTPVDSHLTQGGGVDTLIPLGKRVGRLRYCALSFLLFSLFLSIYPLSTIAWLPAVISGLLVILFSLAVIVWQLILMIQRTRDIGRRAYWALLMFVPIINIFYGLFLMFWRGAYGENQFGSSPHEKLSFSLIIFCFAGLLLFYSYSYFQALQL